MKIKRLYIKEYQQFKDVEFKFNEHKNCIIGQSGTGKTTLLNLISGFTSLMSMENPFAHNFEASVEIDFEIKDVLYSFRDNQIFKGNEKIINSDQDLFVELLKGNFGFNNQVLFITSDVINYTQILSEKEINKPILTSNEKYYKANKKVIDKQLIYITNNNLQTDIYKILLHDIDLFDDLILNEANKIASTGSDLDFAKFREWKKKQINPREKIAHECLNPILSKFYLKLDLDNFKNYFSFVHLCGNRISPITLSTGTKQIILSSLPIYLLRENLSIVLFDEPERSLFPDIQKLLPDHYNSLAPDAQFFFVTHSPFFAAGYNEDERINLYFNDAGYVTQDTVTKGFSPRGDDANDMLFNDFKVSSMNEYGLKMHKRYLELNNEADYQLAQGLTVDKKLLKEIRELGDKYNF